MNIKIGTATLLHVLAVAGQVLNLVSGVVPVKWQPVAAGVLALIQMGVGKLQHASPPPAK
jgi:hypothetical protein